MSNMSQIPRETSDVMAASLGPTSTKNLADSLPFRDSQEDILWRAIFETDEWIKKKDYSYVSTKFTIILPETDFVTRDNRKMKIPEIALYVKDAIWPDELHYLSKRAICRLFEKSTICTVQSPAIYGLGGRISNTEQLLPICGMYLFYHGKEWETFLYGPKCPPVSLVDGYRHGERDRVIGWRKQSWYQIMKDT
ncbi:hypothetical protein BDV33DRAFT_192423 [Aspergillus novoparasiticus]|uniref:Uncharacterized protein n=1 Tax=Aspergillus novoparasiticus TaxID=986946 RepID=A0A5N6ER91_9EURO|nr:hypothetical protein BDV33DRAFT_192423 [Aspergillus novoparasiticus]